MFKIEHLRKVNNFFNLAWYLQIIMSQPNKGGKSEDNSWINWG